MSSNQTATIVNAPSATGSRSQQMLPLRGIEVDGAGGAALLEVVLAALDNGNNQNRLRAVVDDIDDVPASSVARWLGVLSRLTAFDGADYDRLRTLVDNADAQSSGILGLLGIVSRLQAFNGTTFDRLRTLAGDSDDQAAAVLGLLGVVSRGQVFDGSTYDRARSASASNLALFSGTGATLCARPGDWAIEHRPAVSTQATITRSAGGAGVRHICTSVACSIVPVVNQSPIDVVLRDGGAGAGTVLWSTRLNASAGFAISQNLSGLNIVGSANTAMTLEFTAAPTATNFAGVSMTGYAAV